MLARRQLGASGGCGMKNANAGRVLGRYVESVLLAVLFALASAVPVAWVLQMGPDQFVIEAVGWHPLGTGQALALALGAVIPAGVLGGLFGGLAWMRRPVIAPVTALAVAWFVGIVALPVVATALDIPLRAGIACLDACQAKLRDGDLLRGVAAYGESLLAAPFTFYVLAVPAALFVIARRARQPAIWVAAWLSLHAAINPLSIVQAGLIYGVLLVGVLLWSAWLWARDARGQELGVVRRWAIAVGPAALVIASTWGAAATFWVPNVPQAVQGARIGTATVQGFNPPDPSDWLPQVVVPRTPAGSGCFDPVVRPAGRLDVCWEPYRDNRESLPGADYYQFRLLATLHAAAPSSWVAMSIVPVGDERTAVAQLWPSGVLDGPCRSAAVEGMDFLTDGEMTHDVANDLACGRTTAARADAWQRHWVIWTCAACGADQVEGRQVAIRELVATSEGGVPSWQVYAELGQ
jgi:hypothetical protein